MLTIKNGEYNFLIEDKQRYFVKLVYEMLTLLHCCLLRCVVLIFVCSATGVLSGYSPIVSAWATKRFCRLQ